MYCQECRNPVGDNDRFCPMCGVSLTDVPPVEERPDPPAIELPVMALYAPPDVMFLMHEEQGAASDKDGSDQDAPYPDRFFQ